MSNPDPSLRSPASPIRDRRVLIWPLSASISAAAEEASFLNLNLGIPRAYTRWFCLVRQSRAWLCPRQGRAPFSINEDAVFASFLLHDGNSLVLMAVSSVDVLTVLTSDSEGNVVVSSRNDGQTVGEVEVLAAVAPTFESAIAALMGRVRENIEGEIRPRGPNLLAAHSKESKDVNEKQLQSWYNSLAYCTWNGLGQDLSEEKLLSALDTLSRQNIRLATLIIDDNWQSLDFKGDSHFDYRWTRFEANQKGFPKGLKHTVSKLREEHPGIVDIAVWHGLLGYWNATSPEGQIAKEYKTRRVKKQNTGFLGGGSITVVAADDVHRMYNDFYNFLSDAGITAVKTDVQSLLDQLDGSKDRRELIARYQNAWYAAVLRHLGGRAISSMSQMPQVLFRYQLPTNMPTYTVRNSDDFFPDEPSSHSWHVFCNAHNAVLTQHLNLVPDWDMFQTNHAYSGFHAAARCVSGGVIYFTDEPGSHDLDLLGQISAETPQSTIVLRPAVGRAVQVYMAHDEPSFCKIRSSHTVGSYVVGILGVFNTSKSTRSEFFKLWDMLNTVPEPAYLVRSHQSGNQRRETDRTGALPPILLDLAFWGWDILTAYPLSTFFVGRGSSRNQLQVAVLGLMHKMTGAAALTKVDLQPDDQANNLNINVGLKALGILGIYVSDLHNISVGETVFVSGKRVPAALIQIQRRDDILEIDLTDAWRRLYADTEWAGEIIFGLTLQ